jgi:hypothetical protein
MARRPATALAVLCAALAAAPAAARADETAPISSAAQLYTCCSPAGLQERMLSEAADSGAEYVRVDVELHGIFGAGPDQPDWSRFDRMVSLARKYDVKLLGILRGSPLWLTSCPEAGAESPICAPRDPREWGRLAGEVAKHARGEVDHWEIVNEPDASWAFTGSAEDYARMLSAAYDAIKAEAPEAKVVFGGVERPREHEWVKRVFATPGADAAHKFDIAAVHLRLRLRNHLPDLAAWLTDWRRLLRGHGFDGPIWVTEHGYPAAPASQWDPSYRGTDVATGEAAQARLLHDSIPLLAKAGAGQVFVTLRDNLSGEYLSEGIEHIDETAPGYPVTRRPSFGVLRDLAIRWDPATYTRSGAREQQREAGELIRLSGASAGAGQPVASAVQAGAAEGHTEIALDLVRAARRR